MSPIVGSSRAIPCPLRSRPILPTPRCTFQIEGGLNARIHVRYRYWVDGRELTGERFRFEPLPLLGASCPLRTPREAWRAGMQLGVRYDPAQPEVATIQAGPMELGYYEIYLAALALGVGFIPMMGFAIYSLLGIVDRIVNR
jgi:hypothetical protein